APAPLAGPSSQTPQAADEPAERLQGSRSSPQQAPVAGRRRRVAVVVAAVLLGLGGLWLAGQIIIEVTGKDGRKTTVTVPEGSQVKVGPDGRVSVKLPPDEKQPPPGSKQAAPVVVGPEKLDQPAGIPLSARALVRRPAPLKGLRSWTIE